MDPLNTTSIDASVGAPENGINNSGSAYLDDAPESTSTNFAPTVSAIEDVFISIGQTASYNFV